MAGWIFTLTAGQDVITSTSSNLTGFTSVFLSNGGNDTITGGVGLLNANDILVDASTADTDVLNGQLLGAIQPTNWTNIETLNFEMLADTTGFATNTGISLAGAQGYKTIGLTGAGRTAHLDDVRTGTTVNVNSAMTVGVDMLTDLATDTLAVNLNGVTGATLNVNGGTNDINQLTINSNTSANTATITMDAGQFGTATTDQITIGGSQNLTLTAADTALTAQRINATTNTATVTLASSTTGAATINANLMTGVDAFNFATSANSVDLTNLATGATAVNLSAAVTTLTLSAREAGASVNVTAANDIDNVTQSAGTALGNINLSVGTSTTFTGGLTVNLATLGGNTGKLVLSGTGKANDAQSITLTAGNFDGSGFTVNDDGANANDGLTITAAATGLGNLIVGTGKNDTILGGDGADDITAGAGSDRIVLGSASQTGDIIRGFDFGTNATNVDVLAFDVSSSGETGAFATTANTATTLLKTGTGGAGSGDVAASDALSMFAITAATADNSSTTANANVLTFDSLATFNNVLTGTSQTITISNAADTGVLLALVDEGNDIGVYVINVTNDATLEAAASSTKLATLVGVADFTNINAGDIVFI